MLYDPVRDATRIYIDDMQVSTYGRDRLLDPTHYGMADLRHHVILSNLNVSRLNKTVKGMVGAKLDVGHQQLKAFLGKQKVPIDVDQLDTFKEGYKKAYLDLLETCPKRIKAYMDMTTDHGYISQITTELTLDGQLVFQAQKLVDYQIELIIHRKAPFCTTVWTPGYRHLAERNQIEVKQVYRYQET